MTTQGEAFVPVRGVRAHYRVTGEGPPVLLLHGIGRTLEDWTEQQHRLRDRYRVYSLDLAGFGSSQRLDGPCSLSGFADFVTGFLDAVGEHRRVVVMGNSLGGAVALAVAAAAPERVSALVLANSAGFGQEVAFVLRLLALRPLGRILLRPNRGNARRTERALFFDRRFATEERVEHALRAAERPGAAEVFLETVRGLGTLRGIRPQWRERLLAQVAPLRVPTLVVWGDHDLILPAAHLDHARRSLPHARTHLFADTGHMPQIERAEEFHELASAFLKEELR
ncbi:alpha/beta fold hydrolase [Streptacidiphilus sp. PAMC 29251]